MFRNLKERIERELVEYIQQMDKFYGLSRTSLVLSKSIKDFILRKGKRIRPILFIIGYSGFAKKMARGLYSSALSQELLHDFLLIHDDIIDKSKVRRGKPSLHILLNNYLKNYKYIKFNGQDLAIVIADIIYAMAIHAFLSIKENLLCKEKALKKFIEAAIYTENGEFLELLSGIKHMEKMDKEDIYKIYDYKTAYYTFASPLTTGAILAGANQAEIKKLWRYGIYLGRAFQIKDDILGMFGSEKEIGKSILTDLQEGKKTVLIWYAYHHAKKEDKLAIRKILTKVNADKNDLLKIRKILINNGALIYAKQEILNLLNKSQSIILTSNIKIDCKAFLKKYSEEILKL
jgi:geranylgeranyl diphosphate synthase type I